MSTFQTPLRLEVDDHLSNGRAVYRLLEPFSYEIGQEGSKLVIEVPEGFITDFASVPRFLWSIVPPNGRHGKAAVVHDYLYRKESGFSKWLAESIFYDAMEVLNVTWWKRKVMYWSVRIFGGLAYNGKQYEF